MKRELLQQVIINRKSNFLVNLTLGNEISDLIEENNNEKKDGNENNDLENNLK